MAALQQRLDEAEGRNKAGAAAYDKLKAELRAALEKVQVAEHLQQRSDQKVLCRASAHSGWAAIPPPPPAGFTWVIS